MMPLPPCRHDVDFQLPPLAFTISITDAASHYATYALR